MKLVKLNICVLILNIFALALFAQEKTKVELVDELKGNSTSELIWLAMGIFNNKLRDNPKAMGYIVSYGSARQVNRRQLFIREHIKNASFDSSRFVFVNGGIRDNQLTQLWLVPEGADTSTIGTKENVEDPKEEKGDSCPTITVTGPPAAVESGESMTFTANVSGVNSKIKYNWAVDKGTISSGQGTPKIIVNTKGLEDTTIVATVSVVSDSFSDTCNTQTSEAGIVQAVIKSILVTEYKQSPNGYVRMSLDNFLVQLQNYPMAKGYIFSYGSKRQIQRHDRLAKNHIKLRNFENNELIFINGGEREKPLYQLWVVPDGADSPKVIANKKKNCSCPIITITPPPTAIQTGNPMTFVANVSGYDKKSLNYRWSVDKGSIISGQGTHQIKIDTNGLIDTTITAKVKIEGDFCTLCNAEAIEKGIVIGGGDIFPTDTFIGIPCNDISNRIDNFLIQLLKYPQATGYIIIYGQSASAKQMKLRIENRFNARISNPTKLIPNIKKDKLVIVLGGGNNVRAYVEMWIVPEGVDLFEPYPHTTKQKKGEPYIFTSNYAQNIDGCSEYSPNLYGELLKENPESRGNIVIFETSEKNFRNKEQEILSKLVKSGITKNRLKTFFVKVKRTAPKKGIELWFLP